MPHHSKWLILFYTSILLNLIQIETYWFLSIPLIFLLIIIKIFYVFFILSYNHKTLLEARIWIYFFGSPRKHFHSFIHSFFSFMIMIRKCVSEDFVASTAAFDYYVMVKKSYDKIIKIVFIFTICLYMMNI